MDDLFYKYGRIKDIDIKFAPRPPCFAFITFGDVRDAEDAVRGRDGYHFAGGRLRVEMAKGTARDGGGGRGGETRERRRSNYGVIVTNLPQRVSWQDLKDHMRKSGDVAYANIDADGSGIVEFSNESDMEHAVRKVIFIFHYLYFGLYIIYSSNSLFGVVIFEFTYKYFL